MLVDQRVHLGTFPRNWSLIPRRMNHIGPDFPAGIVVHVTAGFGALASLFVVGRLRQKSIGAPYHPLKKRLGRWSFKGEVTGSFCSPSHWQMQHLDVPRLARVSVTLAYHPMTYTYYIYIYYINKYIYIHTYTHTHMHTCTHTHSRIT